MNWAIFLLLFRWFMVAMSHNACYIITVNGYKMPNALDQD